MKEKVCGIYKITNKINGMSYIGQSVNCYHRWQLHKVPSRNICPIDRIIKEYGKENFTFKIEIECSLEELDYYERETIKKYNTMWPNGYNKLTGGRGGFDICDDTRRILSENRTGEKNSFYNHKHTEEAKRKISESQKGVPKPQHSEETRRKISESQKGISQPKYKYLTPSGEIRIMDKANADHWHKDWKKIEE